jgi:3-deoxy-7-phosphoheptulonate synthase
MKDWKPDSWRQKKAIQLPQYDDSELLSKVMGELSELPPLVTSWEIEKLRQKFILAEQGKVFILQGGDCAESFNECTSEMIVNKLKVLLQMSLVLTVGIKRPIVRIGRMAGQYAKPRSDDFETIDGVTLPSYRGDIINKIDFNELSRRPDPYLMIRGYEKAALVMNFVRALTEGGFADLHHPENWNLDFVKSSTMAAEYNRIVQSVSDSLEFFESISTDSSNVHRVSFFASHEGLHLPYEEAQTRFLQHRSGWYNLSTHFPWIGVRTTDVNQAHIEYFRGIRNPIGIKIGIDTDQKHLEALLAILNPSNEQGRIVLITRFGASNVQDHLPRLIEIVKKVGAHVTWIADPMHGNTEKTTNGYKTRAFDKISEEIIHSINIHKDNNSFLGGVHLELSGDDVTECIGGASGLNESDLSRAYKTQVDPRLNYEQSLEIAMMIANQFQSLRRQNGVQQ